MTSQSRRGLSRSSWLLFGALVLVPAGLTAQEEEDCNCDPPWRMSIAGSGLDLFGDRPMLGVSLDMSLNREIESIGVRVSEVMEDGPADDAGIREDDIITSVDGHDLTDALDARAERGFDDERSYPAQRLIHLVRELEEGEPVEIGVDRDGEAMTFTVTPEELDGWGFAVLPNDFSERLRDMGDRFRGRTWSFDRRDGDEPIVVAPRVELSSPGNAIAYSFFGRVHGLELVELNPGLGAYFGTDEGVLVADLDEDSELGLQAGDVVVAVEGREVEDPQHLHRILRSYRSGDDIEFTIFRDGAEQVVTGQVR